MPRVLEIGEDRPHGGSGFAVLSVSHARLHGDFLKRSVAVVMEQEVLGLIVGHVDIGIAIAIEIARGHTHGAANVFGDAGLFADICEGAVAVVVEQHVGAAGIIERAGIVVGSIVGAVLRIELHVASDEEIHAAVVIVIQPGGADRPARHIQAGLGGDVFEGAIAFVAVQRDVAVAGDQQVHKAVVIEVGGDDGGAEEIPADAGLFGDVGEFAVAVVAIEMIVRSCLRRFAQRVRMDIVAQRLAGCDVEVRQAVVVVVEPDAAGAGAFEQRAQLARAEAVGELDAGGGGGVFEADGYRGLVGG